MKKKSNTTVLLSLALLIVLTSCSSIGMSPKYRLNDGNYAFRQPGTRYEKTELYTTNTDDSIRLFKRTIPHERLVPDQKRDQFFLKKSFDIDVMTVPFKFRPAIAGLPRQLTTDFNGDVFVGYRMDRFRISSRPTPVGWKQHYSHRALSVGAFGGLGSTAISASTTQYKSTDEYNGLVMSRGLAVMLGVNNLTVGVGIGWDYLTDRDKGIWIYQNKAWYGLTLGLNLN